MKTSVSERIEFDKIGKVLYSLDMNCGCSNYKLCDLHYYELQERIYNSYLKLEKDLSKYGVWLVWDIENIPDEIVIKEFIGRYHKSNENAC